MAISGNASLDTGYTDVISDFDALGADLDAAANEEDAVAAGGQNDEYNLASQILASDEWKEIQNLVNEMRLESSAADTPQFYER
jgi:hypothetical protein